MMRIANKVTCSVWMVGYSESGAYPSVWTPQPLRHELGVCLGHQAIGQAFGGSIIRAPKVIHGKTSSIHHDGEGVFLGLNQPLVQTRYHSLVIDPATVPDGLEITAWSHDESDEPEVIMGIRHKQLTVEGVQFHPESIASQQGHELLRNFLAVRGGEWS